MESHNNLRLLFISLYLVICINAARSPISPDDPLSQDPETTQSLASPSPSPSPSADPLLSYAQFFPSQNSEPRPESTSPNFAESKAASSGGLFLDFDLSSTLNSVHQNPEVKKICDSTDYPALCLATVIPFLHHKATVDSVLEAAVKASNELAKHAQAVVKEHVEKPGTPPQVSATLKDCKDGYDTVVDNFHETMSAFAGRDIGTIRSMLSAVITYIGDCEDEFAQMRMASPLSDYSQKLTNMTSNCLAIASLLN